jgi:transposase
MPEKCTRKARTKHPDHPGTVRAYRFPLLATPEQNEKLFAVTALCWEIRNMLVVEREANRSENRTLKAAGAAVHYLTRADQYVRVAQIAKSDRRFSALHSQVLQNIAERVSEGTKRWLEALHKKDSKVRPPQVVERKDVRSFTYPQYGSAAHLKHGMLHLSKIGPIRVLDFRKMRGLPKSVTIRFEQGRWWASISCAIQEKDVFRSAAEVADLPDAGGDPGLRSLLTLSDGTVFDPPKALKGALTALRYAQRDLSRKFEVRKHLHAEAQARAKRENLPPLPPLRDIPYSHRLTAQLRKVAKLHTKVERIREHHHRKIACQLEKTYRLVAMEEHGIQFMIQNRKTARSAADRGIAAFKKIVEHKMGMRHVPTANRRKGIGGNSQTCICGAPVPKGLGDRIHDCPQCGLIADRDMVSANIVEWIAFGTTHLQTSSRGAGQALRRGGTEGCAEHSVMAESAAERASEVPVKRPPPAFCERRNTMGAEATMGVETFAHPEHRLPNETPGP